MGLYNIYHETIAHLSGHNSKSTPRDVIIEQINEPRPLPMGRREFEEWSDRIIVGAMLPLSDDPVALIRSTKNSLAQMIMHLGPTESHKPDAFFIHTLRKGIVNQVAYDVICEFKREKEKKIAEEQKMNGNDEGRIQETPTAVVSTVSG